MTMHLMLLLSQLGHVATETDSGGNSSNFAAIFLLAGFVFYGLIYFKYRNINKRHSHESETESTLHNVRAEDHLVKSLKGLSEPRMAGENSSDVKGALRRFF